MFGGLLACVKQDDRMALKVIGRKGEPKVDVIAINSMQKLANTLRQGRPLIPKGVWRFKSFEEADAWLTRMMAKG
jgi:hypothetical protein